MKITVTSDLSPDGAIHSGAARITEAAISVDLKVAVADMDPEDRQRLIVLLADELNGDEIVEAFDDVEDKQIGGANQLTARGTLVLDHFVERATKLGRLPDDWEPDWVSELRGEIDRLQRLIVEGRTDDALQLLRDIAPDHNFLSPAAEKMLAGIHGAQGALAL
ncbi:hypothetical protein [Mesorhizobium sp.]|uniref:hypothetical protein n=1 Tax=Mesorhizobium sp. TaxID=1871066 RepID=UPI000FE6D162|nr:hypothetical protein [Mesorhizobium sp.]RWO57161.1 MAG: hypothetical protein EOS14_25195 [Mesorhizobium sp.]